jgi:hypothetical protein
MHNVSNILSPFLKSENPKKNLPCVMWHRDFSVQLKKTRFAGFSQLTGHSPNEYASIFVRLIGRS